MKKLFSLFLILAMLFTCAFSSLAETAESNDALKQAEMEALMQWLSAQITEEEAEQVLTWDRDTILKKLEGYGQPLTYITKLVWTSEKEESAKDGFSFEHIEQDLMDAYWWNEQGYSVSIGWVTCYYLVQVYDAAENTYCYLCTYDRDQSAFISVDVAPLDFESINLFLEKDEFSKDGAFTLEDDDHLVWQDDAVTPAEGIVLNRG